MSLNEFSANLVFHIQSSWLLGCVLKRFLNNFEDPETLIDSIELNPSLIHRIFSAKNVCHSLNILLILCSGDAFASLLAGKLFEHWNCIFSLVNKLDQAMVNLIVWLPDEYRINSQYKSQNLFAAIRHHG